MLDKKVHDITKEGRGLMKRLTGKRRLNVLMAIGIIGIVMIGLTTILPKTKSSSSQTASSSVTAEEFVTETENKLENIIKSIDGAGQCQVMVTLENGVEYVYATEKDINSDSKEGSSNISESNKTNEKIIVVDTEDGSKGLLITEIQPTVKGVVVVCNGGDQEVVQQRVIDAVTTALGISANRVCVTKLSQ